VFAIAKQLEEKLRISFNDKLKFSPLVQNTHLLIMKLRTYYELITAYYYDIHPLIMDLPIFYLRETPKPTVKVKILGKKYKKYFV
jgi:hypothetical protein